MPIEPQAWGQIVLASLGIVSTIVTGFMGILMLMARRKSQMQLEQQRLDTEERLRKKDLEIEQAKQATLKANAELERAAAESQRIRDQSAADLLTARASTKHQNELLEMARTAFHRIADSQISTAETQTLTAQALNKNSETINLLGKTMTEGHDKVMERLMDITLTLGDLPKTIDGNLSPLYEHVKKLAEAANGLSVLVQSLQLTILAQFKPATPVENGNYTDEVKGTPNP